MAGTMNLAIKLTSVSPIAAPVHPVGPPVPGPPDRFAEQLARLRPMLRQRALMMTRNTASAEDLVHQAIERALCRRAVLRPGSNMVAWLTSVMHNLFIDDCRQLVVQRKSKRDLTYESQGPDESVVGPMDLVETSDLRAAMNQLRDGDRRLLELAYFERISHREISRRLSVKVSTTGTRIHRVKAKLRRLLQRLCEQRAIDLGISIPDVIAPDRKTRPTGQKQGYPHPG
jgi:RNA polymerase sigma-70 factor (ECF subfamily)